MAVFLAKEFCVQCILCSLQVKHYSPTKHRHPECKTGLLDVIKTTEIFLSFWQVMLQVCMQKWNVTRNSLDFRVPACVQQNDLSLRKGWTKLKKLMLVSISGSDPVINWRTWERNGSSCLPLHCDSSDLVLNLRFRCGSRFLNRHNLRKRFCEPTGHYTCRFASGGQFRHSDVTGHEIAGFKFDEAIVGKQV